VNSGEQAVACQFPAHSKEKFEVLADAIETFSKDQIKPGLRYCPRTRLQFLDRQELLAKPPTRDAKTTWFKCCTRVPQRFRAGTQDGYRPRHADDITRKEGSISLRFINRFDSFSEAFPTLPWIYRIATTESLTP